MGQHRVVALLNPPQSPFELACASEVFGTHHPESKQPYAFSVCTEDPGLVPTTAGYPMLVEDGLSAVAGADTVIVPGWQPPGSPASPRVLEALRSAHARGARVVAIC